MTAEEWRYPVTRVTTKKAEQKQSAPAAPPWRAVLTSGAAELADRLRPGVRDLVWERDPQGFRLHDDAKLEVAVPGSPLVLRVSTGWQASIEVLVAPAGGSLRAGDSLAATDFAIDNYGPEGCGVALNGKEFVQMRNDVPVSDADVQGRARAFADELVAQLGAPSFLALADALWHLVYEVSDEGGRWALWRLRSIARVVVDPGTFNRWAD